MTTQGSASFIIVCAGVAVEITAGEPVQRLLRGNFEGMLAAAPAGPALHYDVEAAANGGFIVSRVQSPYRVVAKDSGELIYLLESDLVVQLQLQRPDLVFVHAAVLELDGSACLVTGPSGAGKSTTCWGLLHHGFGYLSDELAPLSLDRATVAPYRHALCMKRRPPAAFPVPAATLRTERGFHVPPSAMPSVSSAAELPISTLFYVHYSPQHEHARVEEVHHAAAAARLYPNVLNALAHPNDGLGAVAELTSGLRCFLVDAAELGETCRLMSDAARRD